MINKKTLVIIRYVMHYHTFYPLQSNHSSRIFIGSMAFINHHYFKEI